LRTSDQDVNYGTWLDTINRQKEDATGQRRLFDHM